MNFFKKYIGDLFLSLRFYILAIGAVVVFVLSFIFPWLGLFADVFLAFFIVLCLVDYIILFIMSGPLMAKRAVPQRISNGFEVSVRLLVRNNAWFPVSITVIDELPSQLQERDFQMKRKISPSQTANLTYTIRPVERGEYDFGNLILYVSSPLRLLMKRVEVDAAETIRVLPSFQNLDSHYLLARAYNNENSGNRRLRKVGQSMEFEQIKDYVTGDDIRNINWKATARRGGNLMVNHFTEEKSQQIIAIVDKGRVLKMPFKGMSLLDFAINSTLALANLSLLKQDRFGLITFSNKIGTIVTPDRRPSQRENIMQALYKEETAFKESDFENLYLQVRARIKQRSLLVLFTNFESLSSMERQLPYLRSLAKFHYLLLVFFENSELTKVSAANVNSLEDVYVKTIAEKFTHEKRTIVKELQKHGIAALLTPPEELTVHLLNKYLELKSRQVI